VKNQRRRERTKNKRRSTQVGEKIAGTAQVMIGNTGGEETGQRAKKTAEERGEKKEKRTEDVGPMSKRKN